MAELLRQIKGYQNECQKINERIQKVEAKLEENRLRVEQEAAAAKLKKEQDIAAAKLKEEQAIAAAKLQKEQAAAAAKLREEQEAAAARLREEEMALSEEEELERELQELAREQISVKLQEELSPIVTPKVSGSFETGSPDAVVHDKHTLVAETPKVPPPIKVRSSVVFHEHELGGRSVPAARTVSMTPAYLPRFMTPTASSRRKHRFGSDDFDALLAGTGDKVLKIEEKSATHLKKAFGCKFTDLNLSTANSTVVKLERRHTIEPDRRTTLDPKSKHWPKARENAVRSPPANAQTSGRVHRMRHSSDDPVLRSQHYNAVEQPHHSLPVQGEGGKSWLKPIRTSHKYFLPGQSVRPDQREFPTAVENARSSHLRSGKLEKPVAANCNRVSAKGQRRWTLECGSKLSHNRRV